MAINKKLIHFKNKENFDNEVANGNILDSSIVFIQDSKEISTHGTVYKTVNWSVLGPQILQAILTIDDTNSNPVIPVSGDTSWIQGKRCLVKSTGDGSVAICYLSDTDSTKFHDGTDAALDGSMGEFMVDFPENYVKCSEVDGVTTIEIANGNNGGARFRRVLLGAVHGSVNTEDTKLHSIITGSAPTTDLSIVQFHTFANLMGTGWDIMDYETRNKITTLAFAKYGNRDLQAVIGAGDSNYGFVEGSTVSLGNSNGSVNNSNGNVNNSLLGIENYFNNVVDWLGGIHVRYNSTDQTGLFYIYDGLDVENEVPMVNYRTITPNSLMGYNISKMLWGEYADLFPIATDGDISNFNTYYADVVYTLTYQDVQADMVYVVGCGGGGAWPDGGGSFFSADDAPSDANPIYGARLQFRGNITVIENPEEFKQL